MRSRFRSHVVVAVFRVSLALCLGVSIVVALGPASPASADTNLGLPYASRLVVDGAHSHVFVSGGNVVEVLTYQGQAVKTITALTGASGMVLDGSTLYVALTGADAIAKLDTGTLAESGSRIDVSPLAPDHLAMAGGLLWFTHGKCNGSTYMASVDPTNGTVVDTYKAGGTHPTYCPEFATSPAAPNALLAWDSGISPPTLFSYHVSSGAAVLQTSKIFDTSTWSPFFDVTITPGGSTFVAAQYKRMREYNLSDFSPTGLIYQGGQASELAVSAKGGTQGQLAAVGNSVTLPDLFTYKTWGQARRSSSRSSGRAPG